MSDAAFCLDEILPLSLFAELTDVRLKQAGELREHAQRRQRRYELTNDGKLVILAADHPARMVTGALGDPLALGNRREYLGRILRVLAGNAVDGLMGTPDIIEEALALDMLGQQAGKAPLLDDKLLIGCMNRGGLAGTVFEMRDAFTAYDGQGLRAMNLDGAKLMFRLDPDDPDSGRTIEWSARAVNDCLDHDLPVFVEPLLVKKQGGKYVVQKDAASLTKISGVAAALGRCSLNTWLKLPYGPNYDQVALSTTCPILMLGGEAVGDPLPLLRDIEQGMRSGANVRGALIGRNVLFPGAQDPLQMARAVSRIVHEGVAAAAAL
jgi:DhnA family fructose-bisphosphate aldolase class Ia